VVYTPLYAMNMLVQIAAPISSIGGNI
jgi:hypothetical protein